MALLINQVLGTSGAPVTNSHPPSYYVQDIPAWWDPNEVPEQVVAGIEAMLTIYEVFSKKGLNGRFNGLLIHGGPGLGKTSAAAALGYFWANAGTFGFVRFVDFEELMARITTAQRFNHHEARDQIYAEMYRPEVLILDDAGKRISPDHALVASTLVNGRINRGSVAAPKITIMTTNCDLRASSGREQFSLACDGRTLQRFTSLDVDANRWGPADNLRELAT